MATWVVGDVHGCAEELGRLIGELALGPGDGLVAVGDLFHRGPDPAGVLDLLAGAGARFVLGNHERAVLRRVGLAPERADGADRPPRREEFPPLDEADLAGDGGRPLAAPAERRADFLRFLQGHAGYFLEGEGRTPDGRGFLVVHAGLVPGRRPRDSRPGELTGLRRLGGRGRPYWYEVWQGPELVLFGHTPSRVPRAFHAGGRLVALGLDTGCVYGGALTAYSPELDELRSVPAARAWARR